MRRGGTSLVQAWSGAGLVLCWAGAIGVLVICGGIVFYLLARGYRSLTWAFFSQDPAPSLMEALSGGIRTPLVGTVLVVVAGMAVAFPVALGTAVYLAEYARKGRLVAVLRGGIDVLAGVPTIVFAIFGLAIFTHPELAFLSTRVEGVVGGKAFGRSFLTCGLTMATMALPYVIKTMEESLRAVPQEYRDAAYALGDTKWSCVRRVVIRAALPGIVTATILGIGRIAGDTAIVWLTLGGSMTMTGSQPWWSPNNWVSTLRNTGSTLTSYIFYSSPAGEGNSPNKAFGASLVLILLILVLNWTVDYLGRRNRFR